MQNEFRYIIGIDIVFAVPTTNEYLNMNYT